MSIFVLGSRFNLPLHHLTQARSNISTVNAKCRSLWRAQRHLQCWKGVKFTRSCSRFHICSVLKTSRTPSCLQASQTLHSKSSDIAKPETGVNMLSELDGLFNENDCNASQLVSYLTQIVTLHYQDLYEEFSWMQTSVPAAYTQIVLEEGVETVFEPIQQHPNFERLCQLIEKNWHAFTCDELTECLKSLLYLRLSRYHPLVTKLYMDCCTIVPDLGIVGIENMAQIIAVLVPMRNYDLYRHLNYRVIELTCDSSTEWTVEKLLMVCHYGETMNRRMPTGLSRKFNSRILEIVKENEHFHSDLELAGQVLKVASRFSRRWLMSEYDTYSGNLISSVGDACKDVIQHYRPHHIAKICVALKLCRYDDEELNEKLELRAVELLREVKLARDVSNLFHIVKHETSAETKRKFLAFLHYYLRHEELDFTSLANICDSLLDYDNVSLETLTLLQAMIAKKAKKICSYMSVFKKVAKLLIRVRFPQNDDQATIARKWVSELNENGRIDGYHLSVTAAYLLSISHGALPAKVMERLLITIPKWSEAEVYMLALGVNHMQQNISIPLQRQLSQIRSMLYIAIDAHIDDLDFESLYQMTLAFVSKSKHRDPLLTDRLMEMHMKFIGPMNDVTMYKTVMMFHSIKYDLPEMYDKLAEFIIDNHEDMSNKASITLLMACADVDYLPSPLGYVDTILKVLAKCKQSGHIGAMLLLLQCLSVIGIFPEKELRELFQLETLQEIDRYCSGSCAMYCKA